MTTLPTKEEIKAIVANQVKAGFVEVRPPPTVCYETMKRRIADAAYRRKKRAETPTLYDRFKHLKAQ